MTSLQVFLHVPEVIIQGLTDGSLERVGGVIRETSGKQIVAWLRDMDGWRETGKIVPHSLNQVIDASSTVQNTTSLISPLLAGSILNFSMSAVSLWAIMRRMDQLSTQIDLLRETVKTEFKRERDMRFKIALQAARDVFEGNPNSAYSENAARSAIDGLYEARENFLDELSLLARSGIVADQRALAQHYLLRAMYAEMSRVRCYLIASVDTALKRLSEDMPRFRDITVTLVKAWLGDKPAAYFYRDMTASDVGRFIAIQRWLSEPDDPNKIDRAHHLFELIDRLRPDFWNKEISGLFDGIRLPWTQPPYSQPILADQLTQAEIVIENFQHLQGFELELRSLRLSASDWDNLVSEQDLAEHGFAIILDKDKFTL